MSPAVEEILQARPSLRLVLKKKVCVVVAKSSPAEAAILHVRMRGRKAWNLKDWIEVLKDVDACEQTVEDWLEIEVLM